MEMIYLDPPAELDMPIGMAMFTQRAIRRLDRNKPISNEHLKLVLDAASKAPSGGNVQVARFIVVRDREKVREFGKLYHEAWWSKRNQDQGWEPDQELPEDSPFRMAALLAREMGEAPVVVLGFSERNVAAAESVLPGAQNLMLAARALGIGSVLTTLHPNVMNRFYALFNIPSNAQFHCCIPLGYPRGGFGLTKRFPTAATTFWDGWGNPPPWNEAHHQRASEVGHG